MKELETERYLLRLPKMEDAEKIFRIWGNDDEYQYHRAYKNIAEVKVLIKGAITESTEGVPFWFIEEKETSNIVGYMKISDYSIKDKKARVHFYVIPALRETDSPEEILRRIIKYIFDNKVYETIVLQFYDDSKNNTKSLSKLLEKIGMKREGVLRNRLINNKGEKTNEIVYSILKEEWENY